MDKRIIFLASCPLSLLNFRLHLMLAFKQQGYTVFAVAPAHDAIQEKLQKLHIQFIATPLARNGRNPLQDIGHFISLVRLIRQLQPHIIFSYTIKPVIYGSLAAKIAQVPFIYSMITGTGYAFTQNSWMNIMIGKIAQSLLKVALATNAKVFFQNKDNLSLFLEKRILRINAPHAITNGSGVDIDYFSPCNLPLRPCFLMTARLLRDKGIREYLTAAKRLKAKYSHVIFKLVGWIDTNPSAITSQELTSYIEDDIIDYVGRLDDVRPAIAASDVFVLPSYAEGTPRSVLEAMAMGRPIVTTDAPGCRETVTEGVNGYLVPIRNSVALSDAMEKFIIRPELILQMGRESRRLATEKYDVHQVNAMMLQEMAILST